MNSTDEIQQGVPPATPMPLASKPISNPIPQTELNGELGNPLAAPDLGWFTRWQFKRSYWLMNREYHAIIALSSSLKSLNVIVKNALAGFAFYLHKRDLVCGHVLGLDIYTLGRTAQLCQSSPACPCQDEIDQLTPRAIALLRPSLVRDRIKLRSNSAKPPRTVSINLPCGVAVSAHGSLRDRKPAPRSETLASTFKRSLVLLASRSSLATIRMSPLSSAARTRARAARSVFAPLCFSL
jgi:hypothetical protein